MIDIGCGLAEERTGPDTPPNAPSQPVGTPNGGWRWLWPRSSGSPASFAGPWTTRAADTPFERWNPLLDAARELGEAYATRLAAQSLARTLESVEDPELRTVLRPLTALYGVVEARRNAATLMGVGLLAPDVARSLPVVLDQLCEQVARACRCSWRRWAFRTTSCAPRWVRRTSLPRLPAQQPATPGGNMSVAAMRPSRRRV
jgi:acyl-CoA oxidase